jgi:hypothetical protein
MRAWRTEHEQEQELRNKTISPESSSINNDSSSSQKKKKKLLVCPLEFWEVSDKFTTTDLDILARLFSLEV